MDFLAVRLVHLDLPDTIVELELGDGLVALVLDRFDDFGQRLRIGWRRFIGKPARLGGADRTASARSSSASSPWRSTGWDFVRTLAG
jgi:hypothetical protein